MLDGPRVSVWHSRGIAQLRTFRFEYIEGVDAVFWRAGNLREAETSVLKAVIRNAFQRVMEVVYCKAKREKTTGTLSAAAVAALYRDNLSLAPGQEAITNNAVDSMLTIYNRAVSVPEIMEAILSCENLAGWSPFDSVVKMQLMVSKSRAQNSVTVQCVGRL